MEKMETEKRKNGKSTSKQVRKVFRKPSLALAGRTH